MISNYTIIFWEFHYKKWETINAWKIFQSVQKFNNNIWIKKMNR